MEIRKEIMVNVVKKIVDDINAMSFANLNDQQLHSLLMMREIACGVVDNRVEKVTKDDLKKTLASSIDRIVGSCKDINNILSKIPCEGMDEQQTQSMLRIKEIVMRIVTKQAKLATTRHCEIHEPVELQMVQANGVDEEVGIKNIDSEEIQRRLFGNMGPRVNFEALGISNPPSWSVKLPDGAGGTKDVQVLNAPLGSVVEGMPPSSYLPEPHKSAFEYLLELIAALKHVILTRETTSGAKKIMRSTSSEGSITNNMPKLNRNNNYR